MWTIVNWRISAGLCRNVGGYYIDIVIRLDITQHGIQGAAWAVFKGADAMTITLSESRAESMGDGFYLVMANDGEEGAGLNVRDLEAMLAHARARGELAGSVPRA